MLWWLQRVTSGLLPAYPEKVSKHRSNSIVKPFMGETRVTANNQQVSERAAAALGSFSCTPSPSHNKYTETHISGSIFHIVLIWVCYCDEALTFWSGEEKFYLTYRLQSTDRSQAMKGKQGQEAETMEKHCLQDCFSGLLSYLKQDSPAGLGLVPPQWVGPVRIK